MSIFSRQEKKDELVILFDIGSSSVKAALLYLREGGVPKIITSIREPIALEEEIDIDRFLKLTLKALDTVTEEIFKKGLGAPERVFCIFSSPWHISQTRIINYKEEKPFSFTPDLANKLIEKEVNLAKDEYQEKYAHPGNAFRVIELKNIKVMLNGYEAPKPLYKKAKEAEITLYVSLTSEEVASRIEKTIGKYFALEGNRKIKFTPFTLAAFTMIRDMYPEHEDFLLIDVGGEITDISMIKANVLREATSFPLGINFMIRRVAKAMKCEPIEAKSYISLYKNGHAAPETLGRLEPAITKLRTEWLTKFQSSLANLSSDISIPAFVYITVDKELADFFSEVIKTEQFNQYTLTESKFQITFLNVENLNSIASFEGDAIFNAFLAIDSAYLNRFLK